MFLAFYSWETTTLKLKLPVIRDLHPTPGFFFQEWLQRVMPLALDDDQYPPARIALDGGENVSASAAVRCWYASRAARCQVITEGIIVQSVHSARP